MARPTSAGRMRFGHKVRNEPWGMDFVIGPRDPYTAVASGALDYVQREVGSRLTSSFANGRVDLTAKAGISHHSTMTFLDKNGLTADHRGSKEPSRGPTFNAKSPQELKLCAREPILHSL